MSKTKSKPRTEGSSGAAGSEARAQAAWDLGYERAGREHLTGVHYADGYVPSDPELNSAFHNGKTAYRDQEGISDDE